MHPIFFLFIFIFGLLFGSFSSVLITRWHEKVGGILLGRSKCPKCHHTLSWFELLPLVSFVFLRGKCRKCGVKIPLFYPLAELIMGSLFLALTFIFFRNFGDSLISTFILLLGLGFITGVYILADIRYLEIPDEIMVPGILSYLSLLLIGILYEPLREVFFDYGILSGNYIDFIKNHLWGAIILYTFLFMQILIPASYQLYKKRKWKEILLVGVSYFTFFISILFSTKQVDTNDEEELETWVGGGDLRIALFIGITLGISHGIFAFFAAYMIGSLYGIFHILLSSKTSNRMPFGPFLGIGWLISLYFYNEILIISEYYKSFL